MRARIPSCVPYPILLIGFRRMAPRCASPACSANVLARGAPQLSAISAIPEIVRPRPPCIASGKDREEQIEDKREDPHGRNRTYCKAAESGLVPDSLAAGFFCGLDAPRLISAIFSTFLMVAPNPIAN